MKKLSPGQRQGRGLPVRWREPRTVLTALGTVLVLTAGALIAVSQGFPRAEAATSRADVYVTNGTDLLVGRINSQVNELNSALRVGAPLEVYQDQANTVILDGSREELRLLDPVAFTLTSKVKLPIDPRIAYGGGQLGIADGRSGKVFTGTPTDLTTLDPEQSPPMAVVGKNPVLTVATTGEVFAAAPGGRTVLRIPVGAVAKDANNEEPAAPNAPAVTEISLPGDPLTDRSGAVKNLEMTAVGDIPVVLDRTAGLVRLPTGSVSIADAAQAVLQQPSVTAPYVLVATKTALLRVPISGGAPEVLVEGQDGIPAAPVYLDGCVHAAWAGAAPVYAFGCGGKAPSVQPIAHFTAGAKLVFRVNGHAIVLNDVAKGASWLLDKDLTLINNWDQVRPLADDDKQNNPDAKQATSDTAVSNRTNCQKAAPEPLKPVDDRIGVRAGRSTLLRVLDNDASSDCTMVTIVSAAFETPTTATLSVVANGQALQVDVPATVTELPPITYAVTDGTGSDPASARAAVQIVPADLHPEPKVRTNPAVEVEIGARITTNVLAEYTSPSGDDLYLTSAQTDTGDDVTFRPDGTITFTDKGASGAIRKTVRFVLTDGTNQVVGKLIVEVRPERTIQPLASPMLARVLEGVPVTVPLLNAVISPTLEPARISKLTPLKSVDGLAGMVNSDGTVTVSAAKAGIYYFSYQVNAAEKAGTGVLRVDASVASGATTAPIPTLDVVYVPQGGVGTLDPAANDTDPTATGLAVTSVMSSDPAVSVVLDSLKTVTVSAHRAIPPGGLMLKYTVANGSGTADGHIRVVPITAIAGQSPIATNITAMVRAGDAVTIPITGYVTDPAGEQLSIKAVNSDAVPAESGVVFATKSTIRYRAPATVPKTAVRSTYTVVNTSGRESSAVVQFNVVALGQNSAPRTPPTTFVRVLAGAKAAIALPLGGLDPDGDWVTVAGLNPSAKPPLGQVAMSGAAELSYQAFDQPGIDQVSYTATDPYGQTVKGTVSVLVVAKPASLLPPVAPNIKVSVRPGRTVGVDVLGSVVNPSGGPVKLGTPAVEPPSGWKIDVDSKTSMLVLETPASPIVQSMKYNVISESGLTASGILTVDVSAQAPLKPPVAKDIFVSAAELAPGVNHVEVSIEGKVGNPSGQVSDLKLAMDPAAAGDAVVLDASRIKVPITKERQVLTYVVTNNDTLSARAFIVVPGLEEVPPPSLIAGKLLEVTAGETKNVPIADYVAVAPGRHPIIPNGASVSAQPGQANRIDDKSLSYTTAQDASGNGTISVQVTDGKGEAVVIGIPVKITPVDPPACIFKSISVNVEAGKSVDVDLGAAVDCKLDTQKRELTYRISHQGGAKFAANLDGAKATITAPQDAKGRSATFTVTATDARNKTGTGTVTATATGSTAPPATVQSPIIKDGRPGKGTKVDVLNGAFNPFPATALTVTAVRLESGDGAVSHSGRTMTVTPAASAAGSQLVASFTVADATGDPAREVTGRVTVIVQDRPKPPGTPTVLTSTSKSADLTWDIPFDAGSPISGYHVSYRGGRQQCGAPPCTINGLTPGVTYTFTVQATNAIGTSEPSHASGPITPDTEPNTPAPPQALWVKKPGTLQVNWKDPGSSGTAVTSYDLSITPADPSGKTVVKGLTGTSYTWQGLANGTAYSFSLVARNASPKPSGSSGNGNAETPSTIPAAPTGLVAAFGPDNYNAGGSTISVRWAAPGSNGGSALTRYIVKVASKAGNQHIPVDISQLSTKIQNVADGVDYQIAVVAENRSGQSPDSNTATAKPFSPPNSPVVSGIQYPQANQATISWAEVPSRGRPVYYRIGGASSWEGAQHSAALTGLPAPGTSEITLTACSKEGAFEMCSAPAKAAVKPWKEVARIEEVSGTQNGNSVHFTWSAPPDNGRGPMRAKIVDGGEAYSADRGNGCGQTVSVTVVGYDAEGRQGPPRTLSGTTAACPPPPPPPPSIEVGVGEYWNTCKYGAAVRCYYVTVKMRNFRPNTDYRLVVYAGGKQQFTATARTDGHGNYSGNIPALSKADWEAKVCAGDICGTKNPFK